MLAQFHSVSHVTHMDDSRTPKISFYCELKHGSRSLRGQRKWYKNKLKLNMSACDMQPNAFETHSRRVIMADIV